MQVKARVMVVAVVQVITTAVQVETLVAGLTVDMVKVAVAAVVQDRPLAVLMVAMEHHADLFFYIRRAT